MRLRRKQALDRIAGSVLIALLRPFVVLLNWILRRDHSPTVQGDLVVLKLLGGGSLTIAAPSLLGLRERYPDVRIRLVTTPAVRPFAEALGLFDAIDIIDDRSLFRIVTSGLSALRRCFRSDTFVDLEVHSFLSTVFSTLTCARNRVGLFSRASQFRIGIYTHPVFANVFEGSFSWYERIAELLEAEPAPVAAVQARLREQLGLTGSSAAAVGRVAVAASCSELGKERELSPTLWRAALGRSPLARNTTEVVFLGGPADRPTAAAIIAALHSDHPQVRFENACGEYSLADSLRVLASSHRLLAIDSGLLHFGRLLCDEVESFWGPTRPLTRLKDVPGLSETVHYAAAACSPCIHVVQSSPCGGRAPCLDALFDQGPSLLEANPFLRVLDGDRNCG